MARKVTPKTSSRPASKRPSQASRVRVEKAAEETQDRNLLDKLQYDLQHNQSYLNLILGALIVIVLGVLIYNYFTKQEGTVGPSQQTKTEESGDVSKENLPGKYTVKEGDTLFSIAQKYYDDGYKYALISDANKLTNENSISVGQVLEIPKPESSSPSPIAQASESPPPSQSPGASPLESPSTYVPSTDQGTGGAVNQTIWGEKITSDAYTVQPGDWLSKIAGRAYGDVFAYDRLAKANNIPDPNIIEVGQVLKIPR